MIKYLVIMCLFVVIVIYSVLYLMVMERRQLSGTSGIGPWNGNVKYKTSLNYAAEFFGPAHYLDRLIRPNYWLYNFYPPGFHGEWLNGDRM
jgi:hypothetical protein